MSNCSAKPGPTCPERSRSASDSSISAPVVLKFGGTSLASPDRWSTVSHLVESRLNHGFRPVVVCSASGDTSDRLEYAIDRGTSSDCADAARDLRAHHEGLANELGLPVRIIEPILSDLERGLDEVAACNRVSPRLRASVMCAGELLSSRLLAAWLEQEGLRARWQDAREWLLGRGDDDPQRHYLAATCDHDVRPELRQEVLGRDQVVVTQGFIARDRHGHTVLLGRGGSDTSGAYLSAMLDAHRLEIWTDVPGLFTTDPRQTERARVVRELSWEEAESIARLGGRVLHEGCVRPVREARIPIHVRSTAQPELIGTRVGEPTPGAGLRAVTVRHDVQLVTAELDGADAGAVARSLKQRGFDFEPVSDTDDRLCGLVEPQDDPSGLLRALDALDGTGRCRILPEAAVVSVVGSRIDERLDRIADAVQRAGAEPATRRVEALHASFVVPATGAPALAQALHEAVLAEDSGRFGETWADVRSRTASSCSSREDAA